MSKKCLFICLGNSCRSQMAEAFAKVYGKGFVEVYSAGVEPAGFVHEKTIAVMDELGIDLRGQASKPIDPVLLAEVDWVITLSDEAKAFVASAPSRFQTLHWPVDDPISVFGKDDRVLQACRLTRDEIERRVREWVELLKNV